MLGFIGYNHFLPIFQDQITRWVWDGNNPLHEWTYHTKDRPQAVVDPWGRISKDQEEPVPVDNLITWVFEEGTFKPAAKLTKEKAYSILTDYLGTPKEAYDWWANKVWAIELEAYGKVKSCEGWLDTPADESFIPFRFQGQYHDVETGLYYNRFRYYSPEEGMYVTAQDPIGLVGGNKLYGYVHNPNAWVDVFGLAELVYQLLNDKMEVIYYGITERTALTRGQEHINGTKTTDPKIFSKMEVLAENLTHDQARTMEAELIRKRLRDKVDDYKMTDSIEEKLKKSGLLNKNRGRDIDVPGRKYTGDIPKLDNPKNVDGLKFKCP